MSEISQAGTIEFGEGDKKTQKTALDFFKDHLSALPVQVSFGEVAGGDIPSGSTSPEELAKKAGIYRDSEGQAGRSISFAEAVSHVSKGGK
jgi:hypothetical protein